jgi:YEATS family
MCHNRSLLLSLLLISTALLASDDHVISVASTCAGNAKPWQWTVFLKGTPGVLAHVKCVQYVFDPSFPNPYRTVCSQREGALPFSSAGTTWGMFSLTAIVTFDDGTTQRLPYVLNPQNAVIPDVLSGRWRFIPERSQGQGAPYRIYTKVGDSLQVSLDNQGEYIIVCDGQAHHSNNQNITCSFTDNGGFRGSQQPPLMYFANEVSGDTMTISEYSDAARTARFLMLVYERAP